jgi:hypothetical protein
MIMSCFPPHEVAEALAKVRAACLALPEASERLSHGGPAFFIRKKCFVMSRRSPRRRPVSDLVRRS